MPTPKVKRIKTQAVIQSVKMLLESLGYDLKDPDIKDTPHRVAKVFLSETIVKPEKKILQAFPSDYNSMITLINHRSYSRCPHHLERVILDVNIAYIPDGKLLGLSKLARIADFFSKGLMLQEEITELIADGLSEALKPKGVAVHIIGKHMCMQARGIKSHSSSVVTTRLKGLFFDDIKAREEFFWTIKHSSK